MLGRSAETHAWLGVWAQVTLAPLSLQMVSTDAAMLPVQAVVPRGLHSVPQRAHDVWRPVGANLVWLSLKCEMRGTGDSSSNSFRQPARQALVKWESMIVCTCLQRQLRLGGVFLP